MSTAVANRPGTMAKIRFLRMSASKVRVVLNLIRGKSVTEALRILELSERGASHDVAKCLRSAIANAAHNDEIPAEELFVSECFADEGPTIKRFRPRARGRAGPIFKQTCHVTISVARYTTEEIDLQGASAAAKAASGGSKKAAKKSSGGDRSARVKASKKDEPKAEEAPAEEATTADDGDAKAAATAAAATAAAAATEATEAPAEEAAAEATSEVASETVDSDNDGTANADDASPYGEGSRAATEDNAMPEGFEIKGNDSSKLYHVPGSSFYARTKAEVWFASEEAAEAAGFQKPASQRDEDA